ncbi:MAG: TonB-dependent receptor plug domain protein [Alphaproteobacteria bacterium]|nr:MAG: TonB-dependent receptor plug domain protein [Alphaproteobacteria bacterium]
MRARANFTTPSGSSIATVPGRAPGRTNLFLTAALASVFSGSAFAQDAAEPPTPPEDETIVVTGSRIPRPGFTSNSPIATINSEELELTMPVDVEQALCAMPQFLSGNSSNLNNGSSGTSTVDLRGLTTPRTLVLVDGKRMVGFDPNGLVDVTAIPVSMLERVDIVTGGASAVYGSDAMSGVVNFILKDDFHGAQFDADYSVTDHQDGRRNAYGVTLGAELDNGRGNVALYIGHLDQDQVNQDARSYGAVALDSDTGTPGGSSNSIPSVIDSGGGQVQVNPGAATGLSSTITPFNFNPQNLYQGPQNRWQGLALARYEINDLVEAYGRFLFSSSTTAPALASTATFGFTFEIPVDNPFLSAAQSSFLAGDNTLAPCTVGTSQCVQVGVRRRMLELGPRQYEFDYDTYQALAGLRGSLSGALEGWSWDLSYAHGENSLKRQQRNDIDANRVQQALFATNTTTCVDASNGCAPLNLFDPSTPISVAALAFIRLDLQVQSLTTQNYVIGNMTGNLGSFRSPLAQSPIEVSFGAEHRRETSDFRPDAASASGVSPGFGQTLPVSGEYDVSEYYGEALVPLVENAPFARALNLELGYRVSDYSSSGEVDSYKYGLEWRPLEELRFRGMFQRAVRAANLAELFTPLTPGTGNLTVDPCALTPLSSGPLYTLCLATGAPAARLNAGTVPGPISGQINNFVGGSTTLDPEKSDTVTFGFVAEPSFLEGLSLTLDYYDIKIEDAIALRPASDILAGCYSAARNPTANPAVADCLLIRRNTLSGDLSGDLQFGVVQAFQNIAEIETSGLDLGVRYRLDLEALGHPGWGDVTFSFEGTHVFDADYKPSPSSATISCAGKYGQVCGLPSTATGSVGGPNPEDRWVQRTTWSVGPFDLSYRWRHLSEVTLDAGTGGILDRFSKIEAYDYVDLAFGWDVTKALQLNASVSNVLDKDPPLIGNDTGSTTFNSGNTYPGTYDVLGRVFTVGATARF